MNYFQKYISYLCLWNIALISLVSVAFSNSGKDKIPNLYPSNHLVSVLLQNPVPLYPTHSNPASPLSADSGNLNLIPAQRVWASNSYNTNHLPENAIDGISSTVWSSDVMDSQPSLYSLMYLVDLGENNSIQKIELDAPDYSNIPWAQKSTYTFFPKTFFLSIVKEVFDTTGAVQLQWSYIPRSFNPGNSDTSTYCMATNYRPPEGGRYVAYTDGTVIGRYIAVVVQEAEQFPPGAGPLFAGKYAAQIADIKIYSSDAPQQGIPFSNIQLSKDTTNNNIKISWSTQSAMSTVLTQVYGTSSNSIPIAQNDNTTTHSVTISGLYTSATDEYIYLPCGIYNGQNYAASFLDWITYMPVPYYLIAIHNEPCELHISASDDSTEFEGFYTQLKQMILLANQNNIKLVSMFAPDWADYLTLDTTKLMDLETWKKQGHEIGIFHSSIYNIGVWDGYSNYSIGCDYAVRLALQGSVDTVTNQYEGNMVNFMEKASKLYPAGGTLNSGCSGAKFDLNDLPDKVLYDTSGPWQNHDALGVIQDDIEPQRGVNNYVISGLRHNIKHHWISHAIHSPNGLDQNLVVFNQMPSGVYGMVFHSLFGPYSEYSTFTQYIAFLHKLDPQGNKSITLTNIINQRILPENVCDIESFPMAQWTDKDSTSWHTGPDVCTTYSTCSICNNK